MHTFQNINWQSKLMNQDIKTEISIMKYKEKKALEKELDCEFIRINPTKENFIIFVEIATLLNQQKK